MRYILTIFLSSVFLFATNSKLCKTCHPTIYSEYKESMHFKSNWQKDEIHKAVWQKHPLKAKNDYKCAKCHDPKVEGKLDSGVDCISCHKIKSIKEHVNSNINIYEKSAKTFYSKDKNQRDKKITYHKTTSFFGLFSSTVGSPYHDIDYRNKIYYNGKMCMGCHSHLKNANNLLLCKTPMQGAQSEEQNCITCHMPKVSGSSTTIKITKKHAYHGFLGAFNKPQMLAKYIDLNISKSSSGIKVSLKNNTPHPLFTQPLRVAKLKIELKEGSKTTLLKEIDFVKVLAKNDKPTLPAFADTILKDTMLKANESRTFEVPVNLNKNSTVTATFGFYKIVPKSAKMLGVKDKSLSDFVELKRVKL